MASHRVEGSTGANFSIFVSTDPRELHRIHRGACLELRTRSFSRLRAALSQHLRPPVAGPRALRLSAPAIVLEDSGRAVLFNPSARDLLVLHDRRLRSRGALLVDGRERVVDTAAMELIVDRGLLIAAQGPADVVDRPEPLLEPGAYPIAAWVGSAPHASRAGYVREVLSTSPPDASLDADALVAADELTRHVPVVHASPHDVRAVELALEQVRRVLE